jgi:hypothetical protein
MRREAIHMLERNNFRCTCSRTHDKRIELYYSHFYNLSRASNFAGGDQFSVVLLQVVYRSKECVEIT